jgi:hypothetical protein
MSTVSLRTFKLLRTALRPINRVGTVGTLCRQIWVTLGHGGAERVIPFSKEEIEDILLDLQQKFGFQQILCGIWCVANMACHTAVACYS